MILKNQARVTNYLDVASDEPKNPVKGQKWLDGKVMKTWDGSKWAEEDLKGEPTGVIESDKEPTDPFVGMLWRNTAEYNKATYRWNGKTWETFLISTQNLQAGEVSGLVLTSKSQTGKFQVEGQHAEFINSVNGRKSEISENGLQVYGEDGSADSKITSRMINSVFFGTSKQDTYITTKYTTPSEADGVDDDDGELRVVRHYSSMNSGNISNNPKDYYYTNIRANALFANVIRTNKASDRTSLYLQPEGDGKVRITAPGTVAGDANYRDLVAKNLFANTLETNSNVGDEHIYIRPAGELRVTTRGSTNNFKNVRLNNAILANIVKSTEGDLYIGTSGGLMIQGRGLWEDGNWRPVYAQSFNNKSLATLKTDIKKYPDGALNVINGSDIYNYKIKADKGSKYEATKVGLVIGEGYQSPGCVQSNDGTGIDVYSMASVAWKAIQELSEENKTLKADLDILRKEVQDG